MLLKQLEYFIAVVDHHSFTKAAEECHISQSAVSQHIKNLENELGVDLMKREKRTFTLTPAGEYFYRHGKGLLKEFDGLAEETKRRGEDDELTLRIGYLKGYGAIELHEAVALFTDTYPEVTISIVSGTHEELYQYLLKGKVDVLMSDQRRAFNEDYYNYELLLADCYAEISKKHPLSQQDTLTLDEIKKVSCILISSKTQREVEKDYYQQALHFSNNFLFAETLEEGRLLVVNNRGLMPIEAMGTLTRVSPGIKRIPLYYKDKPVQRKFCAFWPKDKTNYYIEEFVELLRKLLN